MTIDALLKECQDSIDRQEQFKWDLPPAIILVSPDRKSPLFGKGWPRGQLLCANAGGKTVWRYRADRLLKALHTNLTRLGLTITDGKVDKEPA